MSDWNPPPPGAYGQPAYSAPRTEGTAVASLVLGIAGIIVCPLVCSILAIVFGTQAKNKIRQDPSLQGAGMAQAGLILGIIGVAIVVVGLIIGIILAATNSSSSTGLGAFGNMVSVA